MSPPKIFCAVSWLNSTMSGRELPATNFLMFCSVASPSNNTFPSSNWNEKSHILKIRMCQNTNLLEQNDGSTFGFVFFENTIVGGDSERLVIVVRCNCQERFGLIGCLILEETNDGNVACVDEFFGFFHGFKFFRWRSCLLRKPRHDIVSLSST
jgi:hypothetical protein